VGICEPVWAVDGMKDEYTGMLRRSQSSFLDGFDRKKTANSVNW